MNLIPVIVVMPIPALIAFLVIKKTIELRRASKWIASSARITSSGVRVERHRFQGEATQVTNKAAVAYEFSVGSQTFRGQRISIGDNPPDGVEATLKRYPVGAVVPVFYDPVFPHESVLDRSAPVSLGCLWTGAVVSLVAGVALTMLISRSESIDESLSNAFPRIQHPLMMIGVALMGVFCLMLYWAGRRQASQAAKWPTVPGKILTSRTESFQKSISQGNGYRHVTLYRAVIEYGYEVHGREYLSTRIRFGAEESTGSEPRAQKQAARYPVGKEVDVHCDPADPTSAVLERGFAKGAVLLVVVLFLFGVAAMAALKP
jgi:hypothetical protein